MAALTNQDKMIIITRNLYVTILARRGNATATSLSRDIQTSVRVETTPEKSCMNVCSLQVISPVTPERIHLAEGNSRAICTTLLGIINTDVNKSEMAIFRTKRLMFRFRFLLLKRM